MIVYSGIQQLVIGQPNVQSAYSPDDKIESTISIAVKDTLDGCEHSNQQDNQITATIGIVFKPKQGVDTVDSEQIEASKPVHKEPKHEQHVAEWANSKLLSLSLEQSIQVIEPSKGLHANIFIKAKTKTGEFISLIFRDSIPLEITTLIRLCSQNNVWESNLIYNDCPVPSSLYTDSQVQASQNPKIISSDRLHDLAGITLYKEQVIICPITGISYLAKLPTMNKLHMVVNHPLSVYANVENLIKGYFKSGVKLEDTLESQVLAGILLTILKEKGLVFGVKDSKRANLFLSQASKGTLSYAVRYFYSLTTIINRPYLSLNLEHNESAIDNLYNKNKYLSNDAKLAKEAEFFIINYMRACKGESVKERHILPAVVKTKLGSDKVKAKIVTDPVKQQSNVAKDSKTEAKRVLALLPTVGNEIFIEYVGSKIDMMVFMTPKDRKQIQQDIMLRWLANPLAGRLGECFNLHTEAIEDDLFTLSQEIAREAKPVTAGKVKVDFMSLLNKGKE